MSTGLTTDLETLEREARARLGAVATVVELDALASELVGKRSELARLGRSLGQLDLDARREAGAAIQAVRASLEEQMAARRRQLEADERRSALEADRLDLTEVIGGSLRGHLHLLTQTRDELEDVFVGMGYRVAEGPEVETDWYNFEALNMPPPTRPAACGTPCTWNRVLNGRPSRRCCAPTPLPCRSG